MASPERKKAIVDEPSSKRAGARKAADARREAKAAFREALFQALASGRTTRQIADARNASVRAIRREIGHAVAERRLDAPDRFVRLHVARLTKALRAADVQLDRGELAAVTPLLKVVAALDRYHASARSGPGAARGSAFARAAAGAGAGRPSPR